MATYNSFAHKTSTLLSLPLQDLLYTAYSSILLHTMNSSSDPDQPSTTANSRLLPTTFEPPKARNGRMRILEPHGRRRRPKSGDFKLLAAYVAAYVGVLIPQEEYQRFVDPRGEREWKRTIRAACDMEWRLQDNRDFDDIPPQAYSVMREYVARAWPLTQYFDGGWLIKWAIRSTWSNRRKTCTRSNKCMFSALLRVLV